MERGCWNRVKAPSFQLLSPCGGLERKNGGPEQRQLEPTDYLAASSRPTPNAASFESSPLIHLVSIVISVACSASHFHYGTSTIRNA